jgi:hypothetical protein
MELMPINDLGKVTKAWNFIMITVKVKPLVKEHNKSMFPMWI